MSLNRAFICGLSGTKLKNKEIKFLKKYKPWGIILFSRNIKSINQTKNLIKNIRAIFKDNLYPILIDEEGGRVSRLRNFIESSNLTASYFGNLYKKNKMKFNHYYKIYIDQISYLLNILGLNINTVPVLDLKRFKTSSIIGDRSYSRNSKIVSKIGDICISSFHKNNIACVIKHIPGHGITNIDSHKRLPVINKSTDYLFKNDFFPFKKTKSLFAMTAHIIFKKQDPLNVVTHSKIMINLIRKKIGFKNILISDDISMKALKYSLSTNTKKAFKAGCNLVLHCNGNLSEMIIVAKNSPFVDNFILKKTSQFREIIRYY